MKTSKSPLHIHQMSIAQFEKQFPHEDACREYLKGNLWLDSTISHGMVHHGEGEFVCGAIHANTIEGFWPIVKRGIVGTFHKVSKKYLHLYVNEFEFRYNNRLNADIFGSAIKAC